MENDIRTFLQKELVRRCKRNPRYSLRSFAKALDMDQSTLSKILNGKRKLGPKSALALCRKLNLDESVINGIAAEKSAPKNLSQEEYKKLELDLFEVVSDWHHFAILELMTVDEFSPDAKWIAKSLGLSLKESREAISRLERVGMLSIDSEGKWTDTSGGKTTNISPAHTSVAKRHLQKQLLEKAIDALDEVAIEDRDQTSVTMAIDSSKLSEARELITNFRRGLAKFLCRGENRDDVYNLTIALYPLTKIKTRSSK